MTPYKKRKTLGDCNSGVEYQSDLTIVIMLGAAMLIQNGTELEFKMTCENLDCGIFDDIGFCFKNGSDSNIWIKLLIQAKHTLDKKKEVSWNMLTSRGKKAPFAMSKYYDSFCNIIKQIKDESTSKQINDELIVAICTNHSLQENVESSMNDNLSIDEVLQKVFKLVSAQLYKFNINSKDVRERLIKVYEKQENNQINSFLDTFILACRTIDQGTLKDKIKELLKDFSKSLFDMEPMGNCLEKQRACWTELIKQWIYDRNGKELNENDIKLFFIRNFLSLLSAARELSVGTKRVSQMKLEWKDYELYKNLKTWFEKRTNFETVNEQLFELDLLPLCVLKILEVFKEEKLLKMHLFLHNDDYKQFKDHVLTLFDDIDQPFFLAINCTDKDDCNVESRYVYKDGHAKVMIKIVGRKDSHLKTEDS